MSTIFDPGTISLAEISERVESMARLDASEDLAAYDAAKARGDCLVCCKAPASTDDGERCAKCDAEIAAIEGDAFATARDEWRARR
jgi:hypothetical protein